MKKKDWMLVLGIIMALLFWWVITHGSLYHSTPWLPYANFGGMVYWITRWADEQVK